MSQLDTRMADASMVDDKNPWLGLASFTEETRAYFYGRDEEVAELARRVQRKLLTVLFGQSGLGKTSILRAGLVPKLRGQGYCPVYVRIDYAPGTPEPADQIKLAIAATARRAGEWTQAGVAVEGESLWEFLHHRDDVLQDESGTTLVPLLIFDQFEEIFTLAQTDDFGRARAQRFITDLADLVENRPPRELEARLDADDSTAERFDFSRSDYRVLISLREDYLAPLEGLKSAMPSITQNRLRLAPMTGKQALAAVQQPGGRLVTDEVAAAIVRFVAGGAEIANAEVEPSLLSLICRELNDTRLAQGRAEISLDLLEGSHASILSTFYERSLADQAPAVRRIIEDDLLTSSGFRENIAEERLLTSFKAVGATAATLATLVNRRLLRIEERLDVRRVELTHDVLCGVVKASRDLRREREARDATERLLTEQRERETAARRALVRARQIATGCIVLALAAVIAAVLATVSTRRAHRAEAAAQETRANAEQARNQAEHLISYLTDDFARELETFGRLDFVADVTKREIDYFDALPASLKGPETVRNGALAMVDYARAKRYLGDIPTAGTMSGRAVQLLEGLRHAGDTSDATTIALARAYEMQGRVFSNQQDPATLPTLRHALELVQPLATGSKALPAARRAYAKILIQIGFEMQGVATAREETLHYLELAMQIDADLGAKDGKDLEVTVDYADGAAWRMQMLSRMGRVADESAVGADVEPLIARVLEIRPSYGAALHAYQLILGNEANIAGRQMRPSETLALIERAQAVSRTQIKLDPNNTVAYNNYGVSWIDRADVDWQLGRLRESVKDFEQALEIGSHAAHAGSWFVLNALQPRGYLALNYADMGDTAAAAANLRIMRESAAHLRDTEPKGSSVPILAAGYTQDIAAAIEYNQDDLRAAERDALEAVKAVQDVKPAAGYQDYFKRYQIFYSQSVIGQARYQEGAYADAEKPLRSATATRETWPVDNVEEKRALADAVTVYLAMALARQHRLGEAQATIAPVVAMHREFAAQNHGDNTQHIEMARALYAASLADPAHRSALLTEAAGLLDSIPATMRALHSVTQLRGWIRTDLLLRDSPK
jgi:tetratricopeptide (TPR) repeat protein